VFINLDLNMFSLARGVAIAVFAPVAGEGGIALVNGSLSGTLQPAWSIPRAAVCYTLLLPAAAAANEGAHHKSWGRAGELVQTIQNVGNITGNFRTSISCCCTSALADAGNRFARSKLCTCTSSVRSLMSQAC
jgi:hypothetical protein